MNGLFRRTSDWSYLVSITSLPSLSGLGQTNLRLTANTASTNQPGVKMKPSEIPWLSICLLHNYCFMDLVNFGHFGGLLPFEQWHCRKTCFLVFLCYMGMWLVTDSRNSLNNLAFVSWKFYPNIRKPKLEFGKKQWQNWLPFIALLHNKENSKSHPRSTFKGT